MNLYRVTGVPAWTDVPTGKWIVAADDEDHVRAVLTNGSDSLAYHVSKIERIGNITFSPPFPKGIYEWNSGYVLSSDYRQ